jgi:tetratricopeptide (TPR) repeat protein
MKKLAIITSLSLLFVFGGYSQSNKRTSAYMYNNNGEYAKAQEAIDQAVTHEKTINDPKTWLYRGEIYYNIAISEDPEVTALSNNPAVISFESLSRAKELDEKGKYEDEITVYLSFLTNYFYNSGSAAFQENDYQGAIEDFEYAFKIAETDNRFDTIAAFNIGMAGVFADSPEVASEYLQKCVDVDFQNPNVYIYYCRASKQLGDTTLALEVIQQGRERMPEELSILLEEAQLYLEQGEKEALLASLLQAIEADPENANLYFLIGKTYDDMKEFVVAEEYYKKAAEIQPDFFEAYYNIGAIYVNQAAEVQAQANDLPLNETELYNELTEKATEYLEKAVPYLEQSLEIRPDDTPTLMALKEAYGRLKMTDKLEQLNK